MQIALGLIERQGHWFVQRRSLGEPVMPGLWEFPGGKVEQGEQPLEAVKRELQEELGWCAELVEPMPTIPAQVAGIERVFHLFRCSGSALPSTELSWGWFTLAELRRLPIPPSNRAILAMLEAVVPCVLVPPSECS